MKKKKKKYDKIVLLGEYKLNNIEVLISKALINSYISHKEFVPVKNVLGGSNEMKDNKKNPENICGIYYIKTIEPIVLVL